MGEQNLVIVYITQQIFLNGRYPSEQFFYRERMFVIYAHIPQKKTSEFELKHFCIWDWPESSLLWRRLSIALFLLVPLTLPQAIFFSYFFFFFTALLHFRGLSSFFPSYPSALFLPHLRATWTNLSILYSYCLE